MSENVSEREAIEASILDGAAELLEAPREELSVVKLFSLDMHTDAGGSCAGVKRRGHVAISGPYEEDCPGGDALSLLDKHIRKALSYRKFPSMREVLAEVEFECERQISLWGPQNHELLSSLLRGAKDPASIATFYGLIPDDLAKSYCETAFSGGNGSYFHILVEEVCEAICAAAESEERVREELIQVAAVCVSMVGAIDRRLSQSKPGEK